MTDEKQPRYLPICASVNGNARIIRDTPNDWEVVLDPIGKRPLLTGKGETADEAVYCLHVEYKHWRSSLAKNAEASE